MRALHLIGMMMAVSSQSLLLPSTSTSTASKNTGRGDCRRLHLSFILGRRAYLHCKSEVTLRNPSCLYAQPEYIEEGSHGNDDNGIDFILSSSKKRSSRRRKANNNLRQHTSHTTGTSSATMSTAVCIVPPDDAWDAIQRARHLARDTTFYRWPPAIRLFHPFAPKGDVPSLVGKLAEWIEDEMGAALDEMGDFSSGNDGLDDSMRILDGENGSDVPTNNDSKLENGQIINEQSSDSLPKAAYLQSFPVTLSSIQILPHFEVLDARIEALEERLPQRTLGESIEEKESRKRRAEGMKLIEEEERRGLERKMARDKKRRLKKEKERAKAAKLNGNADSIDESQQIEEEDTTNVNAEDDEEETSSNKKKNDYNGPCVIYLSPDDESRARLVALRETLRQELFHEYNAFSPSSSVSPYPERLPRTRRKSGPQPSSQFRPLLPIARFASVDDAIKVAKILQQTWDPLTFNVTDIQFISRGDQDSLGPHNAHGDPSSTASGSSSNSRSTSGVGFGNTHGAHSDMDIPEVRHRQKHGTLESQPSSSSKPHHAAISASNHQRMALTSSGEVEDISRQRIYGCDAMVMLWGEEPEEEIMDEEASLSMIMDSGDNDSNYEGQDDIVATIVATDGDDKDVEALLAIMDDDEGEVVESIGEEEYGDIDEDDMNALMANGFVEKVIDERSDNTASSNSRKKIDYDQIFATAEREYQRMQTHEELSISDVGGVPIFDSSVTDIEAWLDDEDLGMEDEGATVVVGRAQFFMGAMREFIGMPASSAIDSKDRIMSGGVSAVARRKGSVHRLSESWDAGDYGKKDSDRRVS